ncbi:MAG TPA: ATP-binding protein [Patescibacteria group bacterium]
MFQWITHDVQLSLYLSRVAILEVISLLFFLYFTYAFVGEDLSVKKKFLFFIPFSPMIFLIFTKYNAYMLDDSTCTVQFGKLYLYVVIIGLVYAGWSIIKLRSFAKKSRENEKTTSQITIINSAIAFVSIWILMLAAVSGVLTAYGYEDGDQVLLFIPLGLLIFIAILAYAITKYQFLKIKLIAAQVLTYTIWLLIGSMFFFVDGGLVHILVAMTLLLSILFGIMLIKSIKQEVQRKEELQLMADKLAAANDELRKLDNAKTEFISIASHQLRTPLTAIKGYVSLVLEGSYGEINDGVHDALEKVFSSGERLIHLVEELLNVSRIESGRMQYDMKPGHIEDVIKEIYDNLIVLAKDKDLYLDLKLPENGLPDINLDPAKMKEVVSNLTENAIKYTDKGGVTVKAEALENGQKVSGKVVKVVVSDTGIGIPAEEIPYLFKKFSRGKDISRLHANGTGLGLYVVKNIVEAHNGQIWIESDGAGRGTRFVFELPVSA